QSRGRIAGVEASMTTEQTPHGAFALYEHAKVRKSAMTPRFLLMWRVGFAAASLMVGTFAVAQNGGGNGEPRTGAPDSGPPTDDILTSRMVFIRNGTFVPHCAD